MDIKFPWQFSYVRVDSATKKRNRQRENLTSRLQAVCEHVHTVSKVQQQKKFKLMDTEKLHPQRWGFAVKSSIVEQPIKGFEYFCTFCEKSYSKNEVDWTIPGIRWGQINEFISFSTDCDSRTQYRDTKKHCRDIRRNTRKARRLYRRVIAKAGILKA